MILVVPVQSGAMLRPFFPSPFFRYSAAFRRSFTTRRADLPDDDLTAAREWLSKFNSTSVPRHIGEISFSRSGGPGGQNVNKVNSKATLKVPLDSLLPLVPHIIHSPLRSSRYYAARTHSLVIQSEESRKQPANVDACYEKLHQLLMTTAKDIVPGETSPEQRERVKKLEKAGKEARIKAKKMHSSKKSSRRGSRDD
ncbi:peptidyl-tRNA hydrolase domain protein [Aspergillus puulaauensis]|uniref:Prokaryotic-type class I peptide chain release factors domain-containing protein n=1 Tax=Aspergillus puulaauensis TaxID=1220207 RepID=A0A7R8AMD8_9EURO|nr:uncharacterized protein APUU_30810A [Aspergillus puulaauensis]BCS22585.1 hypothetical protein APUU_30810A [Aspergillus puulaauensis]